MRFVYNYIAALFLLVSYPFSAIGQIGIGTTTPNASALLDISSQNQGMLTPRMTTAQRLAINSPANGLLVFDTDLNSFQYFNTSITSWEKMNSKTRDNFVLVKSQADLPTASNGSITLDENTYYEINGAITLSASINLNGAYISGLDAAEDMLDYPGGTIFKGNGGSIRNLTLSGAKAFEITGSGIASNSSLLVQNTVISGMTSGVGSISNLGFYFSNIVQFISNANGITYSNIGNLLLNNQGWFVSNLGTFEKLTGNFGLVEKVSGFSAVDGSAVGFDVSASGLSVPVGVMLNTVFSGTSLSYVKEYTEDSYDGYNFTSNWSVNCPGIPVENDDVATGDINFSNPVGSGASTSFNGTGTNSRTKITGSTSSNALFRFKKVGDNHLEYKGKKMRYFQVTASVSYQATADMILILYIAKNGTVIEQTKVYGKGATGYFTNAGILALPIVGTVKLVTGDDIEIWGERYSGSGNISTVSLNLIIR